MKRILLLLLISATLVSCLSTKQQRIENRRQRKCEKAAYKWGCDWGKEPDTIRTTNTVTEYKDTVVYVTIPGSTVTQHDTIFVESSPDPFGVPQLNTRKSTLNTSLATSTAWVQNGQLKHTLVQRDSVYKAQINNAIRITQGITYESIVRTRPPVKEHYLTWWDQTFKWLGVIFSILCVSLLLRWAIKKYIRLYYFR